MGVAVFLLVLFCLIYEFYGESRKKAPARLIGLLSFLIVIYKARIDSGLHLMSGLCVYLFSVIFCLVSFHLGSRYRFNFFKLVRRNLSASLIHLAAVLLIGVVIFWTLPRTSGQNFSSLPGLGADRISGFSDRVTLNDIGSLKLSRKHVMDLKLESGVMHSNYLKGRVMDHYEKGVWSSTLFSLSYKERRADNRYIFRTKPDGRISRFRVDLEALQGNTLFFFDDLVALQGNLSPLKLDGDLDHLSVFRAVPLAISYTMFVADEPFHFKGRRRKRPYLQLPGDDEYLARINREIFEGSEEKPVPVRARKMVQYFHSEFDYTLDIQNRGASDPLKDFLLRSKKGHCELFASSMVLLLRSQQIPARLVTGFLIPEIHSSGDFYYITESDAHAWVEYYDEGAWHTIDPTPAATFVEPSFLESQLAYLRRFWRNMIIVFDYESQRSYLTHIIDWFSMLFRFLLATPGIWGLIIAFLFTPLYFFKVRPAIVRRDKRIIRIYKRLERLLQKRFSPREGHQGINEYIRGLSLKPALEIGLRSFIADYHHFRFGRGSRPGRDLVPRGAALIRQIKADNGEDSN